MFFLRLSTSSATVSNTVLHTASLQIGVIDLGTMMWSCNLPACIELVPLHTLHYKENMSLKLEVIRRVRWDWRLILLGVLRSTLQESTALHSRVTIVLDL